MTNLKWVPIIVLAADIVRSYETGVTLRQLFYQLVAASVIPNKGSAYDTLSARTSDARREGWFPRLVDRTRSIHRPLYFDGPDDARDWMHSVYLRDRTEGQPWAIYVGVEKDALSALLERWLDPYGIPVLVFRGWSSTTYLMDIEDEVDREDRPTVLLYLGDLDPAGEGIEAEIAERIPFDEIRRIGLTLDQARELQLPENTEVLCERETPSRRCCKLHHTPGRIPFMEKYGRLFQIEVDAIPPETLQTMLMDAVSELMDTSAYEAVLAREAEDREAL